MGEITVKICDRCSKPINYDVIPWLITPYQSGDDSRYKFDEMTRALCEDCVISLTDWILCINSEDNTNLRSLFAKKRKLEREKLVVDDDVESDQSKDTLIISPNSGIIPFLSIGPWIVDKDGWKFKGNIQGSGKDDKEN